MSADDRSRILAVFKRYDLNGNGTIEPLELKTVLNSLDPAYWNAESVDALFSLIDTKKDGVIDIDEFLSWLFEKPTHKLFDIEGVAEDDLRATIVEVHLAWQHPASGAALENSGQTLLIEDTRSLTCFAGILIPSVGHWEWCWSFKGSPSYKRSWVEIGITLDTDLDANSICAKLAPEGSSVMTASGVLKDGELVACLDMDNGTFSISGLDHTTGPSCDLNCSDRPESVHTGVGHIRGHSWIPYVRCSRACSGLSVSIASLCASGRASDAVLRAALGAGQGKEECLQQVKSWQPGVGGQPGPGMYDIQCVLPADDHGGRAGLYISAAAAAKPENLEKLGVRAVLRLGSRYAPLPPEYFVKDIDIHDALDAQFEPHIDACNGFIEEHLSTGHGVLVHCGAGMSRSATALIAFLMLSGHLRYKDALCMAKKAREWVSPNPSFALQLEVYESRLEALGHFGTSISASTTSGVGPGFGDVQCVREPTESIGGLYISGAAGATFRNETLLNIEALVRLGAFTTTPEKRGLEHLTLDLDDSDEADLTEVLDKAVSFVEARRGSGKNALVHCGAGISRSAAVTAAVLMKSELLGADQAMRAVKAARPWAWPNSGFQRQLRDWS